MRKVIKTYHIVYGLFFCLILLSSFAFIVGCNTKPVETGLLIPVEFSSVPLNLILTSPSIEKLEIRVSGNAKQIETIKNMDLKYAVDLYTDLASDPAGERVFLDPRIYYIPVLKKRIFIPPGVKILSITPSYIKVELEQKVIKTIPVSVPYTGKEESGFVALSARVEPSKVMLTGPESVLKSMNNIKTKPVDLTKVNESFKKKMPLDLKGLNTKSDPAIVTVFIPVEKKQVTKVLKDLPVELKNSKPGDSVSPATIVLTIKGGHDMINSKEIRDKIKVSIDVKGLKSGVYVRRALIDLPLELEMTNARPEIFTVKIE